MLINIPTAYSFQRLASFPTKQNNPFLIYPIGFYFT